MKYAQLYFKNILFLAFFKILFSFCKKMTKKPYFRVRKWSILAFFSSLGPPMYITPPPHPAQLVRRISAV